MDPDFITLLKSGAQIKTDELFTFRILHLVFQTVVDPWLTETTERVTADTGKLLYVFFLLFLNNLILQKQHPLFKGQIFHTSKITLLQCIPPVTSPLCHYFSIRNTTGSLNH